MKITQTCLKSYSENAHQRFTIFLGTSTLPGFVSDEPLKEPLAYPIKSMPDANYYINL